jgi:hypothetical protein
MKRLVTLEELYEIRDELFFDVPCTNRVRKLLAEVDSLIALHRSGFPELASLFLVLMWARLKKERGDE